MVKPKHDGPRPITARFLRYADREMVLHQARKPLKNKDLSVFEDIPKELYKLRKLQSKKFKEAITYTLVRNSPTSLISMDSL